MQDPKTATTPDPCSYPGTVVSPMLPRVVSVRTRRRETHDTFTLTLEAPPGLDRFAPGQFNMLYVFGMGEVPISLSGDPRRPDALVHTIRAVGPVTNALGKLRAGDGVGLRGPFGSAWPVEAAAGGDVVLVAGGIGLAPLRPVIHAVLAERSRFNRFILLYGARTPADLLYAREIERWCGRFKLDARITVDRGDDTWHGQVGVVTTLFNQIEFDAARAVGMVCGPEVMMRFTLAEFARRGVPDDRLHVSLERNMQCAVGFCGHCQFGPSFLCTNGPVFRFDTIRSFFQIREA